MDFEEAMKLVDRDAALTHDNNVVKMANRLCIDIALNGLVAMDKLEYRELLASFKPGYSAWVIHTLHNVLDVLKMDLSIHEGFKELVSRGGDTDTNCAIYGAIRGYRDKLEIKIDRYLDRLSKLMALFI
jgi:ADP-ribosylglycohydrolase